MMDSDGREDRIRSDYQSLMQGVKAPEQKKKRILRAAESGRAPSRSRGRWFSEIPSWGRVLYAAEALILALLFALMLPLTHADVGDFAGDSDWGSDDWGSSDSDSGWDSSDWDDDDDGWDSGTGAFIGGALGSSLGGGGYGGGGGGTLLLIIIIVCVVAPALPLEPNKTDLMNRLKKQMGMTGAASVEDIDSSVLWMP